MCSMAISKGLMVAVDLMFKAKATNSEEVARKKFYAKLIHFVALLALMCI